VRRWTMSGAGCWTCSCFWCARRPASHQCMPGKNSSRNDAMDDTPPDRRCAKPLARSVTLKRKECIFSSLKYLKKCDIHPSCFIYCKSIPQLSKLVHLSSHLGLTKI
jgi:hypothetical protein